MARRRPEGIIARHSYGCPARWDVGSEKGPCRCSPRYQAQVRSPDGKRISRTFPTQAAAKACAPRRERRSSAGQTAGRRRRQAV